VSLGFEMPGHLFNPVWRALPRLVDAFITPRKLRRSFDEQTLTQKVKDAVVTIRHMDRAGNENGVGTGFVIDSNGLIATSLHVIGEARMVEILFADGSRHEPVAVHAWDRALDLAVLRLDLKDLPALPLGDSDALASGEKVIAVGNPMGLERSVVSGVISGFRRFDHARMIQLAIPIEPGNSGGPLFNPKGEVLGLLNMKSTLTPNLGFATPINALKPLLARPNSMTMNKWLRLGALDKGLWTSSMGALWSSKVDRISVQGQGAGFGGRSLCHFHQQPQSYPYELRVKVKLGDESGAAGLIFGSDGEDRQYGFYPSNGQLRLTRFDGPSVYSWNILNQVQTPHYRLNDWNILTVRHEEDRILCFVNEQLVIESKDRGLRIGQVGLAKFRDTQADYANFILNQSPVEADPLQSDQDLTQLLSKIQTHLDGNSTSLRAILEVVDGQSPEQLHELAELLEHRTEQIRRLALESHRNQIQKQLRTELNQPEPQRNLLRAALLIAKHDHPELNIQAYEQAVNRMAEDIQSYHAKGDGKPELIQSLNDFLFKENGYHGSFADYENAANSYLNKVIDDREGLPITLSVLFIELADRLGIEGVSGLLIAGTLYS
jgi:serine protease Do